MIEEMGTKFRPEILHAFALLLAAIPEAKTEGAALMDGVTKGDRTPAAARLIGAYFSEWFNTPGAGIRAWEAIDKISDPVQEFAVRARGLR
jgi:hypothetical protein